MQRRTLPVLIGLALLAGSACSQDQGPLLVGLPYSDYAHEQEPFAEALYAEHATQIPTPADPELFFVTGDADLRYTHIDDGARRTPTAVEGEPMVWFFGGSTMFGIGQRDEHTIASEVARLASSAGLPIDVRNHGVSAYVAWQEAGLLARRLATEERPDLIVFLHGVNNHSQLCRHLAAGVSPLARTNPLTDGEIAEQAGPPEVDCAADPDASGRAIAEVVDTAMAEAADHADGVPIVEFWQATPQTRAPSPSDDELMDRLSEDRPTFDRHAAVYRAAIAADRTPGIDLTDVFDDHEGPVFFDWAHTNEIGARIVAEAMWDRALRRQVQQLAE
jgi:hypothetical protein